MTGPISHFDTKYAQLGMLHWVRFHLFDTKYDQLDTFHGAGFVLSMLHRSNLTCFSVPYSTFRYGIGPNGHHSLGQNAPFATNEVQMDIIDWARIHLLILQRSYPIRLTAHHDIISYFEVLHCANVTCFSALDLTN